MPDYPDLIQIAGTVGRNPEIKDNENGSFVAFSVATNRAYGAGEDGTKWYSVAVGDPQVQRFVMDNIRKGTAVVAEGSVRVRESNGNVYNNFSAFRVGLVDWFVKGRTQVQDDDDDI